MGWDAACLGKPSTFIPAQLPLCTRPLLGGTNITHPIVSILKPKEQSHGPWVCVLALTDLHPDNIALQSFSSR